MRQADKGLFCQPSDDPFHPSPHGIRSMCMTFLASRCISAVAATSSAAAAAANLLQSVFARAATTITTAAGRSSLNHEEAVGFLFHLLFLRLPRAAVAAVVTPRLSTGLRLPLSRHPQLLVQSSSLLLRERLLHVRRVRLLHDLRQGRAAGLRRAQRVQGKVFQGTGMSQDMQ